MKKDEVTRLRMRKEWADNATARSRGGGRIWPVWAVQLILELLVAGTAPSAIPLNIGIMYETFFGTKPEELPSINFVRQCRAVVEVVGKTITAIKLAKADQWEQLWTDATSRWQRSFTALLIGALGEAGKIDPIVVSSCIFMEDERSETQAEGIINKVS